VLDICAGPGPVALVAAARGATVVAVDLSRRCEAFLLANARLNDVTVDVRIGDLFEPVAYERFDVISAHPPYVEQPEHMDPVLYLHGGERGDELPYRVLAGMVDHLVPGGEGHVEFHATGDGDAVSKHVTEIFSAAQCELALFTVAMSDAEPRAVTVGGLHDPDLGDAYDEAVIQYRRHLDVIGADGVAALALVRRRGASTGLAWNSHVACRDLPSTRQVLDDHIASVEFAAEGDLRRILDRKVRCVRGAKIVMEAPLDTESPGAFSVRVPVGAAMASWELSPPSATLLQRVTRAETVRDGMTEYATEAGRAIDDEFIDEVTEFVTQNLFSGVLYLADRE
jgi:SAM-dependent methyltransferase